ncbi:hypothetical protein [uncultured Roseobacter sp.]|uniref:hypothetical protein n=1 Tax=uncultured Roseobacter sp. TaxID=114847 RepID=UPI002636FA0A|nr:hypothetical protein [uncultured Roseobacter sp.]
MLAKTSDLRELARMVGYDPATFWRDANFRRADLSGQDLTGMDMLAATLPHARDTFAARGATEHHDNPAISAGTYLDQGLSALARAREEWPQAANHLTTALDAFRQAVDTYLTIPDPAGEAEARRALAETLLLHAYAKPKGAKDALRTAEYELRKATELLEALEDAEGVARCWDARGMALRVKSRMQDEVPALETLRQAQSCFETSAKHGASALLQVRKMSVSREIAMLAERSKSAERNILVSQFEQLERIRSPITGRILAHVAAAAQIEHSAHRLTLAQIADQLLVSRAREGIRDHLVSGTRTARILRWIEAQRCLTDLDTLIPTMGKVPDEYPAVEKLEAGRSEAMRRAQGLAGGGRYASARADLGALLLISRSLTGRSRATLRPKTFLALWKISHR